MVSLASYSVSLSLSLSLSRVEQTLTQKDIERIYHRGPDAIGLWEDAHVSLGHCRLSILDLSQLGAQPMVHPSGKYVVIYNGEIYNFLELRAQLCRHGHIFKGGSDTEVLLAAYAQWGSECVTHFRGMFAFAIWDTNKKTLFTARDRCGEKPFFYWMDEARFVFASEIKGLLPLLPSTPSLNLSAVDMYLHYQYVPEPFTLLEGIHKLPAAYTMTLDVRHWSLDSRRYWSLEQASPVRGDAGSLIREKLDEAVSLTLRADVTVGVALSGGIDSGAIAALAARRYPGPMHAFSIGYPGHPDNDEREQARSLADELGMIFHEVEIPVSEFADFFPTLVRIMDEPIADPAAFGHFAVPKAASELGIKVILTGIGGDEVFWGYDWVRKAVLLNDRAMGLPFLPRSLVAITSRLLPTHNTPFLQYLKAVARVIRDTARQKIVTPTDTLVFSTLLPDFQQALALKRSWYGGAMHDLPAENAFLPTRGMPDSSSGVPCAVLRLLFETWLVSNCLSLGDRVSMAVGVESRLPFLDCELVDLVQGLRTTAPDYRLGHKAWLKQALVGILPDEVLNRPKRGFVPPCHEWLTSIAKRYGKYLCSGHLIEKNILNKKTVFASLPPKSGRTYPLFFVYKVILLEMWYRIVVLREVL